MRCQKWQEKMLRRIPDVRAKSDAAIMGAQPRKGNSKFWHDGDSLTGSALKITSVQQTLQPRQFDDHWLHGAFHSDESEDRRYLPLIA